MLVLQIKEQGSMPEQSGKRSFGSGSSRIKERNSGKSYDNMWTGTRRHVGESCPTVIILRR